MIGQRPIKVNPLPATSDDKAGEQNDRAILLRTRALEQWLTPTGLLTLAPGSVTEPSLHFDGTPASGLYEIAPNNIGVTINGAKVLDIDAAGLDVVGTLHSTGALTVDAGGITVTAGGITATGNSTITGTLHVTSSLTVDAGGAQVTGNSQIIGDLNVTGDVTAGNFVGTWDGTTITTDVGGTGLTTYAAGDTIYYAAGTIMSKLGIGTSGKFYKSTGSAPSWATLVTADVSDIATASTGITKVGTITTGVWNAGAVTSSSTIELATNDTYLKGRSSGGALYSLIGVTGGGLVSIDASQRGTQFGTQVFVTTTGVRSLPDYSYVGDTTTGVRRYGPSQQELVCGGVQALYLSDTQAQFGPALSVAFGGAVGTGAAAGSTILPNNKYLRGDTFLTITTRELIGLDASDKVSIDFNGQGCVFGAGAVFAGAVNGVTTLTATTLAGTLSTAAQASVTSLGTLTSLTVSGTVTLTAATSKIVPGATSLSLRNNADNADNLIITNAGAATIRDVLTVGNATGVVLNSFPAVAANAYRELRFAALSAGNYYGGSFIGGLDSGGSGQCRIQVWNGATGTDAITIGSTGVITTSGALKVTGNAGFNGATPAAPPDYTTTNVTTDRSYDANATTLDEIADVLGTWLADGIAIGLLQ